MTITLPTLKKGVKALQKSLETFLIGLQPLFQAIQPGAMEFNLCLARLGESIDQPLGGPLIFALKLDVNVAKLGPLRRRLNWRQTWLGAPIEINRLFDIHEERSLWHRKTTEL